MSNKNLFAAILSGAAIGAAVGLLLAPQSGKETRQKIRKAGNLSAEQINELIAQGKESWYTAKGKAKEGMGLAADEVDDFIGHILRNGKKWWKSAKNKAGDAADEAADAANRAANKANDLAHKGAEQVRHVANRAENAVDRGTDAVKRNADDMKNRVS